MICVCCGGSVRVMVRFRRIIAIRHEGGLFHEPIGLLGRSRRGRRDRGRCSSLDLTAIIDSLGDDDLVGSYVHLGGAELGHGLSDVLLDGRLLVENNSVVRV